MSGSDNPPPPDLGNDLPPPLGAPMLGICGIDIPPPPPMAERAAPLTMLPSIPPAFLNSQPSRNTATIGAMPPIAVSGTPDFDAADCSAACGSPPGPIRCPITALPSATVAACPIASGLAMTL